MQSKTSKWKKSLNVFCLCLTSVRLHLNKWVCISTNTYFCLTQHGQENSLTCRWSQWVIFPEAEKVFQLSLIPSLCSWQVDVLSATGSLAASLVFVCVSCAHHISSSGVLHIYLYNTDVLDVFAVSRPEKSRWCVSSSAMISLPFWFSRFSRQKKQPLCESRSGVVAAERRLVQEASGSWYPPPPSPPPAPHHRHQTHTHTMFAFCCCFFHMQIPDWFREANHFGHHLVSWPINKATVCKCLPREWIMWVTRRWRVTHPSALR